MYTSGNYTLTIPACSSSTITIPACSNMVTINPYGYPSFASFYPSPDITLTGNIMPQNTVSIIGSNFCSNNNNDFNSCSNNNNDFNSCSNNNNDLMGNYCSFKPKKTRSQKILDNLKPYSDEPILKEGEQEESCQICSERSVRTVTSCGHKIMCVTCAIAYCKKDPNPDCPLCKQKLKYVTRMY